MKIGWVCRQFISCSISQCVLQWPPKTEEVIKYWQFNTCNKEGEALYPWCKPWIKRLMAIKVAEPRVPIIASRHQDYKERHFQACKSYCIKYPTCNGRAIENYVKIQIKKAGDR